MGKPLLAITASLFLLLTLAPATPSHAQTIRVMVDGEPVFFDQPPITVGGRVLVPLRGVFERLGALVQWDPRTNSVAAVGGGNEVQLVIGSRRAAVNGSVVLLDVPAMLVGGRILVPLRFIGEALGAAVDWDARARTVFIISGTVGQLPPPRRTPVPPPQGAVVEGIVFRVDAQRTPQRIFVARQGDIQAYVITPATAIRRTDVETNQSAAIDLEEIRPGDFVRLTVDPSGRVILVRVVVQEVTGRIDALSGRIMILTDGRTYSLDDDVRFIVGGRLVSREELRVGMEVTLRINPQTQRVIEVAARAATQPPAPGLTISAITHDARDALRAGEVLTVVLRGTAGGEATFDIFGVVSDVPLREVSSGTYRGTYVVRQGDNVLNGAIFGHLRVGRRDATIAQADTAVTIDTLVPIIMRRFPQPESTVNNTRPNILIVFQDRGGSGINPAAVRLLVNGNDITGRAAVADSAVAYNPPGPLSGRVTVRLILRDRAGNRIDDRYAFTIGRVEAALIRAVTVNPTTPLRAGEVFTVTLVGEPRGQASFTIEGIAHNVPMTEAADQPGVYFGSYRIRGGDSALNSRVLVQLIRGDMVSRVEATARLTIVAVGVAPPVVTAPAAGSRVGAPLVIRGKATPGYQVVVRIDYRGTVLVFGLQGTYGEVTATADAAGNWQVTVDPSVRLSGAELTIVARAIDPAGQSSEPVVVRVVQG